MHTKYDRIFMVIRNVRDWERERLFDTVQHYAIHDRCSRKVDIEQTHNKNSVCK